MDANVKNVIEFYDGKKLVASSESSMVPPVGSKISIRKETWVVQQITYALDHADKWDGRCMRANVDLIRDE